MNCLIKILDIVLTGNLFFLVADQFFQKDWQVAKISVFILALIH